MTRAATFAGPAGQMSDWARYNGGMLDPIDAQLLANRGEIRAERRALLLEGLARKLRKGTAQAVEAADVLEALAKQLREDSRAVGVVALVMSNRMDALTRTVASLAETVTEEATRRALDQLRQRLHSPESGPDRR